MEVARPLDATWFKVARMVCIAVCLLVLILDTVSIPATYAYLQTICSPCAPNSINLSADQAHALIAGGFSLAAYAAYQLVIVVVTEAVYIGIGLLLFFRNSHNGMALFTAFTLVTFGGAAFTGTMSALAPMNPTLAWITALLDSVGQIAFIVFLYVFPTGRFVPRWTVLPAAIWGVSWILPLLGVTQLNQVIDTQIHQGAPFLALMVTLIIAQVYRYRAVSTEPQRRQTKWVVFGLGIGLSIFGVVIVIGNVLVPASVHNDPVASTISGTVIYSSFLLIPITIAMAILRSKLFDIDILIKRTVTYGLLTAILAGLYFALVIGAQTLTRDITGQQVGQQPAAIVLSTLLIAALFTPLRRQLQSWIDQRFYRGRYNAARTVDAISASLRSEVDLSQLRAHLVDVVRETMMPEHVSLWIAQESPVSRNNRDRM